MGQTHDTATDQPVRLTPELVAAALARFKQEVATPLEHHIPELGGAVSLRKLTALEVRECGKLAMLDAGKPTQRVDQQKFTFLLVNRASVEPKITAAFWAELLQFGPMVTGRLEKAVMDANGMGDDAIEAAGKNSTESPT
jgi:hypothetical protein